MLSTAFPAAYETVDWQTMIVVDMPERKAAQKVPTSKR
jgi:hypothetical protein